MIKLLDSVRKLLRSEASYGSYRFLSDPARRFAWGGPMNSQKWRCLLVSELVQKLQPVAIVETGTHYGSTAEWLAAFCIPVYTCENSAFNFGFSRERLRGIKNISLSFGDSRLNMRQLLSGPLKEHVESCILSYLDAHWNDDLPLAEELDIAFEYCPRAVAVVDDFQVPGDDGYGYDDYGPGKALIKAYVEPAIRKHRLTARYPTTPSVQETGARRGCLILSGPALEDAMATMTMIATAPTPANRGDGS